MDKRDLHSPDLVARNVETIAELFPHVVTETQDEEGNLKRAIDFDLLRQELSDHVVDGPQERYRLDWPGKRAAAFAANAPISKTLRPVRSESVDFDTTKNLFIEGDNLDALKLLQESYLGKVKMIFVDPPYNTGSDFVYRDRFGTNIGEYLRASGELDDDGRLTSNPSSNGRFHSDWLAMIYPRMLLARNLLTDDGAIFVTIGDHEGPNLRVLMDQVFGSDNFVATIVWQSRTSISDDQEVSANHNFVHVYARDQANLRFWGEPLRVEEYANPDNDPRGPWKLVPLDANKPGGDTHYKVVNSETGQTFLPPPGRSWAINQRSMTRLILDGRIKFGLKGDSAPKRKLFLEERIRRGDTRTPSSLLLDAGTTKDGSEELADLLGQKKVFDYPKPTSLLERLIRYGATGTKDCIVLDFFAGSGTTAHALMSLNAADGGRRQFILVQYAEALKNSSTSAGLELATIADVCKERLRRAGAQAVGEREALDVGFRVLKVDTTNLADVLRTPDDTDQQALAGLEASVKPGRTGEDLLFQVLLDWGLELTLPIAVEQVDGHEVLDVDNGALVACFDTEVPPELVRAIARREPLRAVFLDTGFPSDDARINADQIFREVSPSTDVKTI